jgi:hypothetical protein
VRIEVAGKHLSRDTRHGLFVGTTERTRKAKRYCPVADDGSRDEDRGKRYVLSHAAILDLDGVERATSELMNRPALASIISAVIFLLCVDTSGYAQAPTPQAPPLFPKHRRGIYTNGANIEVIDATPQSPPLETDDPSVPDKGEYEINIFTDADLSKDARSVHLLFVDANYGIVPRLIGRAADSAEI